MSGLLAPVMPVIMRTKLTPQTLDTYIHVSWEGGINGTEMMYKPPVMRISKTPIFLVNGVRIGRSIQMGNSRIMKSVITFKILPASKMACWLMHVPGMLQSQ